MIRFEVLQSELSHFTHTRKGTDTKCSARSHLHTCEDNDDGDGDADNDSHDDDTDDNE